MSSALLWILLPVGFGAALLFYRRADFFPHVSGLALTLFLAWAAWQLPIDRVLLLGPFSIEIAPNLVLVGRNFTLDDSHRPLLTFIYLMESFWILGAFLARPGRLFAPISLITIGLLVAGLSVDPFLYAALILGLVVLIFVPLLAPPGSRAGPGVLRFLTFQMFAVPFILFTGWMLSGVEASPGNLDLVLRSGIMLSMGFGFLLALFPFHSWLPMVAEESHPYAFGFVVMFLPAVAAIFGLGFIDRYAWLRDSESIYQVLAIAGGGAVGLGGLWAAVQRNLGRLFSYLAMVVIGSNVQAIGLGGANGVHTFFGLLLPNAWALWVFALTLSLFWQLGVGNLSLEHLRSTLTSHPFLFSMLVLVVFSVAGLPLLAAFPTHVGLWTSQGSVTAVATSVVGSFGLLAGGFRLLYALYGSSPFKSEGQFGDELAAEKKEFKDISNPYILGFLIISVCGLFGFGLLSQVFLSSVPALARMFPQLVP